MTDLERVTQLAEECGLAVSSLAKRDEEIESMKFQSIAGSISQKALLEAIMNASQQIESLKAKLAMQAEAIDSAAPVYTSARNSSAVRKGFEVSGSVMHYIIQPYKLHTALNATQADVDAFMAKKKAEWEKGVLDELYDFHGETDWYGKIKEMIVERGGVR